MRQSGITLPFTLMLLFCSTLIMLILIMALASTLEEVADKYCDDFKLKYAPMCIEYKTNED